MIDSNTTVNYNMTYEIEDTISFYECPYYPHRSAKEIIVSNYENHVYHSIEDATIRFFSVNKLGTQGLSCFPFSDLKISFVLGKCFKTNHVLVPRFDPCDSAPCHGYAQCIPNFEQNSFECRCKSGFLGDGVRRCDGESLCQCYLENSI